MFGEHKKTYIKYAPKPPMPGWGNFHVDLQVSITLLT